MPGRGTVFESGYFVETIKEAEFAQTAESIPKSDMSVER